MTHSHRLNKEYIAGLFDGEGYIGFKQYNGKSYIRYRVEITSSHKGVLEAIKLEYGGRLWLKYGQNECWQLTFESKPTIKKFLSDIEPFLVIKKDKANECLKLL